MVLKVAAIAGVNEDVEIWNRNEKDIARDGRMAVGCEGVDEGFIRAGEEGIVEGVGAVEHGTHEEVTKGSIVRRWLATGEEHAKREEWEDFFHEGVGFERWANFDKTTRRPDDQTETM